MDEQPPHLDGRLNLRRLEPEAGDPCVTLLAKSYDLVIAFDTEYVTRDDGHQHMVSYQVGVFNPRTGLYFDDWSEPDGPQARFRLNDVLTVVLDRTEKAGLVNGPSGEWPKGTKVRVALVMHYSRADMPGFEDFDHRKRNFDAVRKSFVTLTRPHLMQIAITGRSRRPKTLTASLTLFDTMELLPQGSGKLEQLGHLLALPKLTVPVVIDEKGQQIDGIERMDLVLAQHPELFEAYALRDVEVTMRWFVEAARFFEGFGLTKMPKTIAAAGQQRIVSHHGGEALCLTLGKGMTRTGRPGHYLPDEAVIHTLAANAYHGGRNEAFMSGIASAAPERLFIDFDIKGAYSAAMAHLRPLDWTRMERTRSTARLSDLDAGLAVMTVRFRFPEGTRYPSLPVEAGANGSIYPLSGIAHITGPELRVALDQGCHGEVITGLFVPWSPWPPEIDVAAEEREIVGNMLDEGFGAAVGVRHDEPEAPEEDDDFDRDEEDDDGPVEVPSHNRGPTGEPPRPFVDFTSAVNRERARHPKGSPRELLAKTIGNATYGKTAQGVGAAKTPANQKQYFDTRKGELAVVPESALSSPLIAATITGLVRAFVSEILTRLPTHVRVLSTTTDGFLCDATLEEVARACEGPVGQLFADLRRRVDPAGDPSVLEEKGRLLKVYVPKVRGCFPIEAIDGKGASLLARTGLRSEHPFADKLAESAHWIEIARTRTFDTTITYTTPQSFTKQYKKAGPLIFESRVVKVNLDYDLKRQPLAAADVDGLVTFETKPWPCLATFKAWRSGLEEWSKKGHRVLKTTRDWFDYSAWRETCAPRRGAARRRSPFEHGLVAAVAYGLLPKGIPPQERADALTIAGVEGVTPEVLAGFRKRLSRDDDGIASMTRMPLPTTDDEGVIRRFRLELKRLLAQPGRAALTLKQWRNVAAHSNKQPHRYAIIAHYIKQCGLAELVEELVAIEKSGDKARQSSQRRNSVQFAISGRGQAPMSRAALAATHRALRRQFGLSRRALDLATLQPEPHTVETALGCLAHALTEKRHLKLDFDAASAHVTAAYEQAVRRSAARPGRRS